MSPFAFHATSVGRLNDPHPGRGTVPGRRLHRRLDGFGATAEHHQHAPGRVEFHDHVRAFVRRPEVAALVDADGVREGESVEILADLADERAVGPELEQLRRRLAVQGAAAAGAREDVQVLARIDRDAGDFAEVHVRRQLEKSTLASKRISGTGCWALATVGIAPRPANTPNATADRRAIERGRVRMGAIMRAPVLAGQADCAERFCPPSPKKNDAETRAPLLGSYSRGVFWAQVAKPLQFS